MAKRKTPKRATKSKAKSRAKSSPKAKPQRSVKIQKKKSPGRSPRPQPKSSPRPRITAEARAAQKEARAIAREAKSALKAIPESLRNKTLAKLAAEAIGGKRTYQEVTARLKRIREGRANPADLEFLKLVSGEVVARVPKEFVSESGARYQLFTQSALSATRERWEIRKTIYQTAEEVAREIGEIMGKSKGNRTMEIFQIAEIPDGHGGFVYCMVVMPDRSGGHDDDDDGPMIDENEQYEIEIEPGATNIEEG